MIKQTTEFQIYKYNIFWRLFTYLSGVTIFVLALVGGAALYVNSELTFSCSGIFVYSLIFFALFWGGSLIVTPAVSFLKINKDGFTYKDTEVYVKARWVETLFKETELPLIDKNNFLIPLNYEIEYYNLQYLLRSQKDRRVYDKAIPILYFGSLNSKPVKQKIRECAPYLFGFLLTEAEFLATIAALDQLVSLYKNKETQFQLFSSQYYYFYTLYIIHGKDTVNEFFNLMTKHSDKIALHTAVWSEIIKPQIPDYESQHQQNNAKLIDIKNRYE